VVFSSCSHRGIINNLQRTQEVSRFDKIHALVGKDAATADAAAAASGLSRLAFHLSPCPTESADDAQRGIGTVDLAFLEVTCADRHLIGDMR
jgi:hypothetical protein